MIFTFPPLRCRFAEDKNLQAGEATTDTLGRGYVG